MRVVVTRPEPGLSRTCERLAAAGITPVGLPLFCAVTLEAGFAAVAAARPAAWVATSAAAIRAAGAAADRSIPIWTVGPATAEAARAAGFSSVIAGPGDAEGLAARIVAGKPTGDLVYLAGQVRTPTIETDLRAAGLSFTVAEVYDMRPVEHDAAMLRRLFLDPPPDGTLLYSREAALRFARIVADAGLGETLGAMRCLCLSAAVASSLPQALRQNASIADTPDEAGMMRLLAEIRNQASS